MRFPVQRGMAFALAAGCVWFGVLALTRPRRMAAMLRTHPLFVGVLGVRDLASAASLVAARDPRPGLAARAAFDLGDTVVFWSRRRSMAVVAFAYAVLDVAALLVGRPGGADGPDTR